MQTNSLITKKPLTKIPNVLFWKRKVNPIMHPVQTEFVAISTTGDGNWGELILHKTNISQRPDYNGPSLAIDFMHSKCPNKGLGRQMFLFAQNYSKQIGCNGYILGKADGSFTPKKIPHLLYRKWGFSSLDKSTDYQMDEFIKKGKSATIKDFPCMLVFYPPLPVKKQESKIYKFCQCFINLIGYKF